MAIEYKQIGKGLQLFANDGMNRIMYSNKRTTVIKLYAMVYSYIADPEDEDYEEVNRDFHGISWYNMALWSINPFAEIQTTKTTLNFTYNHSDEIKDMWAKLKDYADDDDNDDKKDAFSDSFRTYLNAVLEAFKFEDNLVPALELEGKTSDMKTSIMNHLAGVKEDQLPYLEGEKDYMYNVLNIPADLLDHGQDQATIKEYKQYIDMLVNYDTKTKDILSSLRNSHEDGTVMYDPKKLLATILVLIWASSSDEDIEAYHEDTLGGIKTLPTIVWNIWDTYFKRDTDATVDFFTDHYQYISMFTAEDDYVFEHNDDFMDAMNADNFPDDDSNDTTVFEQFNYILDELGKQFRSMLQFEGSLYLKINDKVIDPYKLLEFIGLVDLTFEEFKANMAEAVPNLMPDELLEALQKRMTNKYIGDIKMSEDKTFFSQVKFFNRVMDVEELDNQAKITIWKDKNE